VISAARKLNVPSAALRRLTYFDPEVVGIVLEERELLCDQAERVVREALNDLSDAHRRDVMARFVLSSENARHRGWGPKAPRTVNVQAQQAVIVGWADEPGMDHTLGYDPAAHGGAPEPASDD
jgi:hypothetical protein